MWITIHFCFFDTAHRHVYTIACCVSCRMNMEKWWYRGSLIPLRRQIDHGQVVPHRGSGRHVRQLDVPTAGRFNCSWGLERNDEQWEVASDVRSSCSVDMWCYHSLQKHHQGLKFLYSQNCVGFKVSLEYEVTNNLMNPEPQLQSQSFSIDSRWVHSLPWEETFCAPLPTWKVDDSPCILLILTTTLWKEEIEEKDITDQVTCFGSCVLCGWNS